MKYWINYPGDKNLSESYDAPLEERNILAFWTKKRTFEKIQENRLNDNDGTFSFHYGPVFPTGSPHIGHIFNAIVKDVFMRYWYQKKHQVVNQFGWDCHGLAVEHEVDKKLGIKGPEDLQQMGIATYNKECRRFVQRHQAEWSNTFDRIGNWVNFSTAYSTMSIGYMESVWTVFKQLFEKGLVYRGTKVLPYSTGCFTHLSHFEAEQNWKEVSEVGATISLTLVDSSAKLLIWTTDPWTLTANLAVGVNPSAVYVKVKLIVSGEVYFLSRNRLPFVFSGFGDYVVLEEVHGKQLENLLYQPLFSCSAGKALPVLAEKCVRDDLGTGIVAMCPYFAEDDYRVCLERGIQFDEDSCPIDKAGRFNQHVPELEGLSTKEASESILETLQRLEHVVHLENVKHKRPHCWRSDVPVIYKATSTWFIHIEGLPVEKDSQVEWHHCNPNEMASTTDWPIGRTRYWGTPLPIWASPNGDEVRCIGSIHELLQLTGGTNISDLHREFVDDLLIPSRIPGNPPLRRVPEVFDCWFESGVMPYIQERSPADLIVEGSDQACGWFYTTSVLSAALSQPPPAKNIFSHGLVLASDVTKLSKRKHNNTDPLRWADKYGADALRLYLVTTPLMNGDNFTPQEEGVREMVENVINPLYKSLFGFVPYFGKQGWVSYGIIESVEYIRNIFEKWILSCAESLLQFYDTEMRAHRVHTVIPRIIKLIKLLQDWYLPISHAECLKSRRDYDAFVAYNVVYKICLMLAPFAPFCIEHIYQIMEPYVGGYFRRDFVHDSVLTEKSNALIQLDVELQVKRWQKIIEFIREERANRIIPIQYRISELIIVHPVEGYLEENELMDEHMMRMANVHEIRRTTDRRAYGARLTANLKANSSLHERISPTDLEEIILKVTQLSDREVQEVIQRGSFDIEQYHVPLEDIKVSYQFDKVMDKNFAIISEGDLFVVIRMNKDLGYYEEGTRLELISSLQKVRKRANIFPSELVTVCYSTKDTCLRHAFEKYSEDVRKSTNSVVEWMENAATTEGAISQESVEIKGASVILYLFKKSAALLE